MITLALERLYTPKDAYTTTDTKRPPSPTAHNQCSIENKHCPRLLRRVHSIIDPRIRPVNLPRSIHTPPSTARTAPLRQAPRDSAYLPRRPQKPQHPHYRHLRMRSTRHSTSTDRCLPGARSELVSHPRRIQHSTDRTWAVLRLDPGSRRRLPDVLQPMEIVSSAAGCAGCWRSGVPQWQSGAVGSPGEEASGQALMRMILTLIAKE